MCVWERVLGLRVIDTRARTTTTNRAAPISTSTVGQPRIPRDSVERGSADGDSPGRSDRTSGVVF